MKTLHDKMTSTSPMYIYATEMVSSYYACLKIKNKRILSIIGSGDQIINAYYFGAKEVVGFDINKYALFMLELKVSAILNLSLKEFVRFFGKNMDDGSLDFNLYNKLRSNLSKKARSFFDEIYKEFKFNEKKLKKSFYFRQRSMIKADIKEINVYLKNEKNYLQCRNIIKTKSFRSLRLDINDIASNENIIGKFDIINLSNALNYLTVDSNPVDVSEILAEVTKKIRKKIKKNGIFFNYSYSGSFRNFIEKKIPPASRSKMIYKLAKLNNCRIEFKRFKGVKDNTLDRINIYKI